jgi:hypothetical protein
VPRPSASVVTVSGSAPAATTTATSTPGSGSSPSVSVTVGVKLLPTQVVTPGGEMTRVGTVPLSHSCVMAGEAKGMVPDEKVAVMVSVPSSVLE